MLTESRVRLILQAGACFATLTPQSAYWHVPTVLRIQQFLAIQYEDHVRQFMVLPFGLNITRRVFTKMMRPVAQALSHQGVEVLMHLDDWLIHASSHQECKAHLAVSGQSERASSQFCKVPFSTDPDYCLVQNGMGLMLSNHADVSQQPATGSSQSAPCPVCL